jgi:hypothetical protein
MSELRYSRANLAFSQAVLCVVAPQVSPEQLCRRLRSEIADLRDAWNSMDARPEIPSIRLGFLGRAVVSCEIHGLIGERQDQLQEMGKTDDEKEVG